MTDEATPLKHTTTDTDSNSPKPTYLVGIDGGGTKCRANIYNTDKQLLGTGVSGSANPVNGLEQTKNSINNAIAQAIEHAKIKCQPSQLIIGAGLAGLHLPAMQESMGQWQHPFKFLHFTTDIHAAVVGAHQQKNGAVIILGTGFSALAMVDGKQMSIGGYGFPINATCSGSWFGLEAIKAVLLDKDQVGPYTSMTQAVFAAEDVIVLATRLNNAQSFEFAKFAPLVFSHATNGDELAISLIKQGADFINSVIRRFLAGRVHSIAFVGGVAPQIQKWLDPELRLHVVEPKFSPEYGAMLLAQQQMAVING
tara:strand:- start:710 stop:1639 length:930 start_codon:yes stop_codon:yes gene_type:complete